MIIGSQTAKVMKTSRKQILQSGVEKSMSSPEVFPASLFLAPDSERERKMTATSGRKCYERYGRFSPIGLLVKTLLESSQWYNPARGKRVFGPDELDAELCIKDGMNYQIAEIHLGDVESSNILCKEIARRWNEFEEWHECKENTEDAPERNTPCLLRTECKEITTGIVEVGYLTSVWGEYGWTEDYLDDFDESEFEVTITHWKPINKPKGVEE